MTFKEQKALLEKANEYIFAVEKEMPMDEVRQEGYRCRIVIGKYIDRLKYLNSAKENPEY